MEFHGKRYTWQPYYGGIRHKANEKFHFIDYTVFLYEDITFVSLFGYLSCNS